MQGRTSLTTTSSTTTEEIDLPSRKMTTRIVNAAFKRDVNLENDAGLGETILGETGTLIQLPSLKNVVWDCPLTWITPNPDQPRSYFDPKKMRELRQTIGSVGQKEAMKVVPYISDQQEIKFFLVDGERRFRTMSELGFESADILVGDQKTLDEVFDISLILNISRAAHNPVEIARAFGRRAAAFEKDPNRDQSKSTIQLVADKFGFSEANVYAHLRLLKLPPKILKLIEKGELPMSSALALLKNKFKKKGDAPEAEEFRLQQVARILLDQISNGQFDSDPDEEKSDKPKRGQSGRITREMIQSANRQALIDQGRAVDALKLETAAELLKALGHLAGLTGKLDELLTDKKLPLTVAGLRSMGLKRPPEVIRDQVLEVRAQLDDLLELAEEATLPPKLTVPKNKPTFAEHIVKRSRNFGNKTRVALAKVLAKTSDNQGQVLTWAELAEHLGRPENDIIGNFNLLKQELDEQGLDMQTFRVRRKGPRGRYEIVSAYRLSWKDARHLNPLEPETLNIKALDPKKIDQLESSQIAFNIENKKAFHNMSFEMADLITELINLSRGRYEILPLRGGLVCLEIFSLPGRPTVIEVASNIKNFSLNFGALEANLLAIATSHSPKTTSVVLKDLTRKEDLHPSPTK